MSADTLTVRVTPTGPFESLRVLRSGNPADAAHHYDITLDATTGVISRVVRTRGLDIPIDRRGWACAPVRAANREVVLCEPGRPLTEDAFTEVSRALRTPHPAVWTGDDKAADGGASAMLVALEAARRDGEAYRDADGRVLAWECGGRPAVTPLHWLRYLPGAVPAHACVEGQSLHRVGGQPALLLRLRRERPSLSALYPAEQSS